MSYRVTIDYLNKVSEIVASINLEHNELVEIFGSEIASKIILDCRSCYKNRNPKTVHDQKPCLFCNCWFNRSMGVNHHLSTTHKIPKSTIKEMFQERWDG